MNSSFPSRVYDLVRRIPAGRVATYGDIAALAGNAKAARAVGAAISHNPDPATIPCHRVVGADGRLHGYAFGEGLRTKAQLLRQEGVAVTNGRADLTARWRP